MLIKVLLWVCYFVDSGGWYCGEDGQGLCPNKIRNLWNDYLSFGENGEVQCMQWGESLRKDGK